MPFSADSAHSPEQSPRSAESAKTSRRHLPFPLAIDFARLPAYRGEEKETAERIKTLRNEAKDTIKKLQETIFAYSPEMQVDLVRRMYPDHKPIILADAFARNCRQNRFLH